MMNRNIEITEVTFWFLFLDYLMIIFFPSPVVKRTM